ncbi:LptF/LptG family permease [Akkermansiaceae bacterium]|nr:LptF/LptG family permease [Akkermansiaceae bacterium]
MSNVPRWLPPLIALALGLLAAAFLVPAERAAVAEQFFGFPDSDILTNSLRPWIMALICLMPAIAVTAYSLGNTFDRYLARQFAAIFLICLAALFGIWLLLDLDDNFRDFHGSKNLAASVLYFYLHRLPAILLVLLPYALLLALIQGLGKFSKSNEIIAMIQGGAGIVRVSSPLIFAGLWCSVLLLALNFQWAPHAEGSRSEMIARAKGLPIYQAQNVLFRDPDSHRLWMVGAFPENYLSGGALQDVEVTTLRPDMSLKTRMTSPLAKWDRLSRKWTFEKPLVASFEQGQSPAFVQMDEPLVKGTWKETPSQIIKPGLSVEYLGIPELSTWLASPLANQAVSNRPSYLTHWHYRWALPFTCLVTVILAAPLSIHFARRGSGSGIFLAVVLSVLMLFSSSVALSLGEAGIIAPALAAWLPNIIFASIGLWLYQRRVSGRPIYQSFKRLLSVNN